MLRMCKILGKFNLFCKIPLAWQQLIKGKALLIIALTGIAFADILMFAQMGFEGALFESAIAPHQIFNADLVIVSHSFKTIYSVKHFPKERIFQARGFAGVESVNPLYLGLGKWLNPDNASLQTILIAGIEPEDKSLNLAEVYQDQNQLQILNQVLFDTASLPRFSPEIPTTAEINNIEVQIAGWFKLGRSFATYGNLICSDLTFFRLFSSHASNLVTVGLIKLQVNTDIDATAKLLKESLPNDILILTLDEFASLEKNYWAKTTPIGFIFGVGVMVSFLVGSVIVYQILFSEVSVHLPEYAMLKAMGYTNKYLMTVLAQEALFLAALGYIPGFICSLVFYQIAANATQLPVFMTWERAVSIFVLTLIMCFIAGAIAMRQLHYADPADLF